MAWLDWGGDASDSSDDSDSTDSSGSTDDSTTDISDDEAGPGGVNLDPTPDNSLTLPAVLQSFAKNPIGFILGAILTTFLAGLETVFEAVLGALQFLVEGDTVGSTEGMIGIADIPRVVADTIGWAGAEAGSGLEAAIAVALDALESAAATAGPAAPLVIGLAFAGTIVTSAYLASFVWDLIKDSINPL